MDMRRILFAFAALVIVATFAGCAAQTSDVALSPCAGGGCQPAPYRIGPGDVLQISVWKQPQLDRTEPVRPDGKISLPLLNDVQAAGLTPMELRKEINAKLTHFLADPEVAVTVTAVHSLAVSVLGEVRHPGRYQFPAAPSVLEALAAAGGLTPFARPDAIVIVRSGPSDTQRIPFDYSQVIKGDAPSVLLRPNDVVVVP